MTEYDSFQNGSSALVMDEVPAEPEIDMTPHAGFDATRGVFITSRGDEIELTGKPINKLMLERIVNENKPKIPRKEVLLLGKHKEMQANANDPDYLALVEEWNAELKITILRYLIVVGVKGQPPQEFIDTQRQIFPQSNDTDMKYFWVGSMLADEDIESFSETILGSGTATTKGVESAANFSA